MSLNPTFYVNKHYILLVSKKRFPTPEKFVGYLGSNNLPDIKKEHTKILHDDDCFYPVKNSFKKEVQEFNHIHVAVQHIEDRLIPEDSHVMVVQVKRNSMEVVNLQYVPALHLSKTTASETTELNKGD